MINGCAQLLKFLAAMHQVTLFPANKDHPFTLLMWSYKAGSLIRQLYNNDKFLFGIFLIGPISQVVFCRGGLISGDHCIGKKLPKFIQGNVGIHLNIADNNYYPFVREHYPINVYPL